MNTSEETIARATLTHRLMVLLVILFAALLPILIYVLRGGGSGETTVITQILLRALGS